MSDEQTHVGPQSATPAGKRPGSARGTALKAAALLLPTLCLVAGAAWWLHTPGDGTPSLPPSTEHDDLFHGWPTPDFVLVLTAQQHGYLLPCGCSDPQYGGLPRRYNFIESLRLPPDKGGRGWPVLAYDLGDVPQKKGPAGLGNVQGLIKYRYAMEAMKLMGYVAVSFGEYEAALPLNDAIDVYALNNDQPAVLGTNLMNKAAQFPDDGRKTPDWGKSYVASWKVAQATRDIKVGTLGYISAHTPADVAALVRGNFLPADVQLPPSVGEQITGMDNRFKFAEKVMPAALKAMQAEKPDFRVLLYQGPLELAKVLPKLFPGDFQVILCLSAEDEPPAVPVVVDGTYIIRLGHKGKSIGVVGVNRTGNAKKPFDMRYQLVSMSPKYDKAGPNPIMALLEKYKKELKDEDYLAKHGKIPHSIQAAVKAMPKYADVNAGYAGSQSCKKCHVHAFNVWQGSRHANAYNTLTLPATKPAPSEFDPECIVCHTVGYRYNGGFENMTKTPKFKDVGCESCHGPCEIHKQNPNDKAIHALINPWKAPAGETPPQKAKRLLKIEGMCRECHDAENDVNWKDDPITKENAFLLKWKHVEHMNPPDERQGGDEE